jgi:hypothetical protein
VNPAPPLAAAAVASTSSSSSSSNSSTEGTAMPAGHMQAAAATAQHPTRQGQPDTSTTQQPLPQLLQHQQLSWQPLLLPLLQPFQTCWKVLEVVFEVVLVVLALVLPVPVLLMWLIVHVAIKMYRWEHKQRPLSGRFHVPPMVLPLVAAIRGGCIGQMLL